MQTKQYALSMQSVCNQYALSIPSICNQYKVNMPSMCRPRGAARTKPVTIAVNFCCYYGEGGAARTTLVTIAINFGCYYGEGGGMHRKIGFQRPVEE